MSVKIVCSFCLAIINGDDKLCCSNCAKNYHYFCTWVIKEDFNEMTEDDKRKWFCSNCEDEDTFESEESSPISKPCQTDSEDVDEPQMMDNGDSGGGLTDSFLTASGQYIVHAEDGDETLGISGEDSMDAGDKDGEPLREQRVHPMLKSCQDNSSYRQDYCDRFLPIANVARIMKNAIPKTGKIAKDAKECVQECVSEFVSFITSEASDRCHQEKRKTINGEDILFAMSTLGFDNYVEPLKLYLQKYREAMKGEKNIVTASASEIVEDLDDNSFVAAQSLTANMLTDQSGQPNVIYTTAYPGQIHFA